MQKFPQVSSLVDRDVCSSPISQENMKQITFLLEDLLASKLSEISVPEKGVTKQCIWTEVV